MEEFSDPSFSQENVEYNLKPGKSEASSQPEKNPQRVLLQVELEQLRMRIVPSCRGCWRKRLGEAGAEQIL
jgi:hypothetical protein